MARRKSNLLERLRRGSPHQRELHDAQSKSTARKQLEERFERVARGPQSMELYAESTEYHIGRMERVWTEQVSSSRALAFTKLPLSGTVGFSNVILSRLSSVAVRHAPRISRTGLSRTIRSRKPAPWKYTGISLASFTLNGKAVGWSRCC